MNIPTSIINAVTKSPRDNEYIYNADDMWTRLTLVRENKIPFIKQDMSMLVNAVELYYKGFILSSGVTVPEHVMKETHSLVRLTDEIESRIMPLSAPLSKTDARDRYYFLTDLSKAYIDARYGMTQYTKDDFDKCFDWAAKQRNLILEALQPQMEQEDDYEYDR